MPPLHSSSLLHFLSHRPALRWALPAPPFAVSVRLEELLVHFADFPVGMVDQLGIPCDV